MSTELDQWPRDMIHRQMILVYSFFGQYKEKYDLFYCCSCKI